MRSGSGAGGPGRRPRGGRGTLQASWGQRAVHQSSAAWVPRGAPHEPFSLHLNRSGSSSLTFFRPWTPMARGISQPVSAALGTGRTAPHASIPHHCHIIATGGLCDLS